MKKPKPADSSDRVRRSLASTLERTSDPLAAHLSNRMFWLLAAALAVVFVVGTGREITRPFMGLHSWGQADGARFARAHVVYGLGYTKGLMTEAVGNPPPQPPKHYVNHPQLSPLLDAGAMWLLGSTDEWAHRGYWVCMGVLALLAILLVLRPLLGGAWALIAGLIWTMVPLTAYFGSGGPCFVTAMLAVFFYLRLIGSVGEVTGPRGWLWAGFVAMNFLPLQFNWTGGFYCLALAIHYAGWCILHKRKPQWPMAGALVVLPLLSASVTFAIMLDGFNWDYKRAMELFLWRAGKGEMTATMRSFDWGAWFDKFWQFAVTNFTIPVIVLAIVGVLAHVGRRVAAYVKARNTKKPVPLLAGSPQLLLLLMPGVLQLFILRGALWKHQYWELPLAPFIAVAAAIGIAALRDALAGLQKKAGAALTLFAGLIAAGALVWVALWADQAAGHSLVDGIVSFWPQESWQTNLSLIVGAALGLAVLVHWLLAGRSQPLQAHVTLAVVIGVCGCFLADGANYYFAIRWQNDGRIALWKELNRLVPADKSLLTFDPVLDNLLVTQSEAKGEVIRAEPAWYIDRPILQVPSKDEADETYRQLAVAYARYVRTMNELIGVYRQGVITAPAAQTRQQQAEANLRQEVRRQVLRDLPRILARLDANRGEAPIYLLPGALYQPQLGAALMLYLDDLKKELDKRYALVYFAPEKEGQRDRNDGFFRAGMVPYYVYDVTKGRQESTTSPQP